MKQFLGKINMSAIAPMIPWFISGVGAWIDVGHTDTISKGDLLVRNKEGLLVSGRKNDE